MVEGLRCGVEALLGSVIDMITIRGAPMACDVVRVRLHLRRVRVLGVLADAPDVLRVGFESASRRLRCPHCGFKCHRVHDTRDKQVSFPPDRGGMLLEERKSHARNETSL